MPLENTGITLYSGTVTISAAGSLSTALQTFGAQPVALIMPASWNAADITFQVSLDGSSYSNMYDASANEYTINASGGIYIILDPADFAGAGYIKLRSGPAAAAIAQDAQRVITLVCREM